MSVITSEYELLQYIKKEVTSSSKKIVSFIIGHLPMTYIEKENDDKKAILDIHKWGEFSTYTFEIGCQLAKFVIDNGKKAQILLIVDDFVEIPKNEHGRRVFKRWITTAQKKIYSESKLIEPYKEIAQKNNVLDCFITQKRTFGNSLYISERKLLSDALNKKNKSSNDCALAYNELLSNPIFYSKETDLLISFIPGQCEGNICTGVLDVRNDLDSINIFFPHIELMGGIVQTDKGSRKIDDIMPITKMFEKKRIHMIRTHYT